MDLYQERNSMASECGSLRQQNIDLQRLNVALKCDLERFTQWAHESGMSDLINKLHSMQDLLLQQKESSSVETLVRT